MPTPTVKMLDSVGVHVSLPPRSVPDSINSEATTTSRVFFSLELCDEHFERCVLIDPAQHYQQVVGL
ncbi:hypothetical protein G418_13039 [Rhodococcus qingshengii BKS 20-40]|nr:hypothetical protein G418_13039 [Rhodococcus qingshengii BKS 20-40]